MSVLSLLTILGMMKVMIKTNEITYIVKINEISKNVWEQKNKENNPLESNRTWSGTKKLLTQAIDMKIIKKEEAQILKHRSKKQNNLRWKLSTKNSPPHLIRLTQITNNN